MLTLLLSLFVTVANAKDETSNGSVIGRPEVSVDCAAVRVSKEHMKPEDLLALQAGCIRAYEATTERNESDLDALGRYHLTTTVPVGGSAIFDGDRLIVGPAAVVDRAFAQNGVSGLGGGGIALGFQSQRDIRSALASQVLVNLQPSSVPAGSTTSTTTTRTTTVPAAPARSDEEILKEDAAKRQADADKATATAEALQAH